MLIGVGSLRSLFRAEENNTSHVTLLARERRFRAAVEAGLREKVWYRF